MPFHYSNEQVPWSGDYTAGMCLSLRLQLFRGFCCLIPRENGNSRADDCSLGGLCLVDVISPPRMLPNSMLENSGCTESWDGPPELSKMSGRRLVARSKWETEAGRDESCLELTQPRDWMRESQINQSGQVRSVCRDRGMVPDLGHSCPVPALITIEQNHSSNQKKERKK